MQARLLLRNEMPGWCVMQSSSRRAILLRRPSKVGPFFFFALVFRLLKSRHFYTLPRPVVDRVVRTLLTWPALVGKLFFLETGTLFHSQTAVLYLTAESTPSTMLVSNYEPSSNQRGPASLTFVCPSSEPYYQKAREGQQGMPEHDDTQDPVFISFHDISPDKHDKITQYAKQHNVKVSEVEQNWYSLKDDQPMTGWMPRGMMPRKR